MSNNDLQRTLYIVLLIAGLVYLFEKAYQLYQQFSHVILLFGLAWLISFALGPVVEQLTRRELRIPVRGGATRTLVMPRVAAAVLAYLVLFLLLTGAALYLIPVLLAQLVQFQRALLAYLSDFPKVVSTWQEFLQTYNIDIDLARALLAETQLTGTLTQRLTELGSELVQSIPQILNSLLGVVFDTTIVLVMSFYMTYDGPRIAERLIAWLPSAWRSDGWRFIRVIDSRFGSFIRSQLLQGLIYGVTTAVTMSVAGLEYVAVSSVLAGVLIMIPLVGGWLAVIAPVTIALFHGPGLALGVYIALIVAQYILFNVVMPRLIGQMIGLHPLLVFLAILIGYPIAGLWGSLFSIPITGVLVSVAEFARERLRPAPADSGSRTDDPEP
jgi:predicted PurR-regulated permease PerM